MIYRKGETVTVIPRKKPIKYYLMAFVGYFVANDRTRIFKLKKPLEDGRNLVQYEMWETLNLNTGLRELAKIPVYLYGEEEDSTLEKDRPNTIDDNNEVTSLLDHYSCWEYYIQTGESIRDRKNFHLELAQQKHINEVAKLRMLDSDTSLSNNYKIGIRYKLIMKTTPNLLALREFSTWKKQFPELFIKLQNDVYKSNDNLESSDSNQFYYK